MVRLGDGFREEETEEQVKQESAIEAVNIMAEEIVKTTSRYDISSILGNAEKFIFQVKEKIESNPEGPSLEDWKNLMSIIMKIVDIAADLEDLKWEFENVSDAVEAMTEW